MDLECKECGKTPDQVELRKCPICFARFCEEHGIQRGGMWFCTKNCAEFFLFSDPDD